MVTSGTVWGNTVDIYGNSNDRWITTWSRSSSSEDGNYTVISYDCFFRFEGTDAQLDNGDLTINGTKVYDVPGRIKNFEMDYRHRDYTLKTGSRTIPHNSDGTKTFNINGGVDVYTEPRSSGSTNFTLNSLYQEIAFNTYTLSVVDDIRLSVYVSVNRQADLLQLSIDGGAWTTYYSGNFSSKTVTVGGLTNPLISGRQYSVRCRVRRDSNGNLTSSSTKYATTETQNKFFGLGDY